MKNLYLTWRNLYLTCEEIFFTCICTFLAAFSQYSHCPGLLLEIDQKYIKKFKPFLSFYLSPWHWVCAVWVGLSYGFQENIVTDCKYFTSCRQYGKIFVSLCLPFYNLGLHDHLSSFTTQKVFICISSVLTWARSKPLDLVSFCCIF